MPRLTMNCTVCGASTGTDEIADLIQFDKVHGDRCGRPNCCGHDADSHDGSGCLDCSCPYGPPHVGYNPKPSAS